MPEKLVSLLKNSKEAGRYFSSLPAGVQNAVSGCGQEISTVEDLVRCVKSLTGVC